MKYEGPNLTREYLGVNFAVSDLPAPSNGQIDFSGRMSGWRMEELLPSDLKARNVCDTAAKSLFS
jgi:hypothetical protein